MAATSPQTARLPVPQCPLCGQPNGCAAVAAGSLGVACWCQDVAFSEELLSRVPPEQRVRACICRACAAAPTVKALAKPAHLSKP